MTPAASPPTASASDRPAAFPWVGIVLFGGPLLLAVLRAGLLRQAAELALYSAAIGAIAAAGPVRAMLRDVDRVTRILLAAVIFAVVFGQFVGDDRRLFPLVRWEMYCEPSPIDEIRIVRLHATRRSGVAEELVVANVLPSLDQIRGHNHLLTLAHHAETSGDDGPLRAFVAGVARADACARRDDPVVRVAVEGITRHPPVTADGAVETVRLAVVSIGETR